MIILDTNVISELFKPAPQPRVMSWVADVPGEELFTTAVTRGELLFGLHSLPDGRRKTALLRGLALLFEQKLANHVLPYDSSAADRHAEISAQRRAQGRPIDFPDAMIAGIARAHGATLATCNVKDFEGCPIALINPWA
jgi:predicted nucleic acid-binding protein